MSGEPACDSTGICEAVIFMEGDDIGMCVHCGAEMFKEKGSWFHHSQEDVPFDKRGSTHWGP